MENDRTSNAAMISVLYLTTALKKYEHAVSSQISPSDQRSHRQLMLMKQNARRNGAAALQAGRAAANAASNLSRQQAADAEERAQNAKTVADWTAAELLKARTANLQAATVERLAREKAKADARAAEARQLAADLLREQKRQAEIKRQQLLAIRLAEEARIKVVLDAYYATPGGQEWAKRARRQRLQQEAESRRMFGDVDTTFEFLWLPLMLVLMIASGSADLSLLGKLRGGVPDSYGEPFASLLSMALVEGAVWFLWMWCYTAFYKTSRLGWYGEKAMVAYFASPQNAYIVPARPVSFSVRNVVYLALCSILFLCCAAPIMSTYVVFLIFVRDSFIRGETPGLVPGFDCVDLLRMKLLVQGCLRVFPTLIVSAMTVGATLCPTDCVPTSACEVDPVVVSQYGLTDCFDGTGFFYAPGLCPDTCFQNASITGALAASLTLAVCSFVSLLVYVGFAIRNWCLKRR